MANPVIRTRMLNLLVGGDFTVRELADRLAVPYNSAAKAIARAMEEGQVHVCGYAAHTAAIYRLGVDVASRTVPEPVAQAESRYEHSPLIAKERGMVEQAVEYFEMSDLLPGVKHFTCDRYRATLSVQSCAERWLIANEGAADDRQSERLQACVKCTTGALHAGKSDLNVSPWKGSMRCARCGVGATRLIARHLHIGCYNRQREALVGANRKGTKPVKIGELNRRSVSYFTAGERKVKTIEHTIGLEEVMFSILRDEVRTVKFGGINVHPTTRALRDNPDLDFSISDDVDETAPVAVVLHDVDSEQDVREQAALPIAASPLDDVAVPVSAEIDVDPLKALRDTVEQLERDAQVSAPTRSRRAMKKIRQQAPRQVRMSNVTVQLMRTVGALPLSAPIVAPSLETACYSAALFSS